MSEVSYKPENEKREKLENFLSVKALSGIEGTIRNDVQPSNFEEKLAEIKKYGQPNVNGTYRTK